MPPALRAPRANPADPEPLAWQPRPTFRARIRRAIGTPLSVGIVVFVVVVCVAIGIVALRSHDVDPGLDDGLSSAESPTTGEESADDSAAPADPEPAVVLVHVVGEVRTPGIVELSSDARVHDAIEAAGGATDRAVLAGVNLAKPVSDGEQIVVPDERGAALGAVVEQAASGGTGSGPVDLNHADAATLETLPRVGPALAQRIIDWRAANGPFAAVDELANVSGIGPKILDELRDRVRV